MGVFTSIFSFIVVIGILVTVHEFGHFWVARKMGVKVLRFSVGFGRPIWRWVGKDGVEYVIAMIPLGGYVRMLGENGEDESIPVGQQHLAFEQQSLIARMAIIAAGPIANLLFAIVAFAVVQMVGISGVKPLVGDVASGSPAEVAEMKAGEEIIAVNGQPTRIWSEVQEQLLASAISGQEIEITTQHYSNTLDSQNTLAENGLSGLSIRNYALRNPWNSGIPEGMEILQQLGLSFYHSAKEVRLGKLVPHGAAVQGGLKSGDKIIFVDSVPVGSWDLWVQKIRENPRKMLVVTVERNGVERAFRIVPESVEQNGEMIGWLGVSPDMGQYVREVRYGFLEGIMRGVEKTRDISILTLQLMWKMLTGSTSTEMLSGPISIAQYAGSSMMGGIAAFFSFLGLVSVSLGILNLLPIPLLDGGHLFFYVVEFIRRKPLSERAMLIGQQIGIVFIIGLMSLALYNDLMRLF